MGFGQFQCRRNSYIASQKNGGIIDIAMHSEYNIIIENNKLYYHSERDMLHNTIMYSCLKS